MCRGLSFQHFHPARFSNAPRDRFEVFAAGSSRPLKTSSQVVGENCSNRSHCRGECFRFDYPKVSFSNHFRVRERGFRSFRGENTETLCRRGVPSRQFIEHKRLWFVLGIGPKYRFCHFISCHIRRGSVRFVEISQILRKLVARRARYRPIG